MKYFLRWCLLISVILVGMFFMYSNGVFRLIQEHDFTKISYLIMVLFFIMSVVMGVDTYNYRITHISTGKFMAEKFMTLGMIGTVLGFIYMLHTCFVNIDVSDIATTQKVLGRMSTGMATALYTTATGLIGSVLLKFQIFNLEQAIED